MLRCEAARRADCALQEPPEHHIRQLRVFLHELRDAVGQLLVIHGDTLWLVQGQQRPLQEHLRAREMKNMRRDPAGSADFSSDCRHKDATGTCRPSADPVDSCPAAFDTSTRNSAFPFEFWPKSDPTCQ